jgi:predicted secreted protein
MTPRILLGVFLCFAACSAPQGKKIGSNTGTGATLPPVATGPNSGSQAAPVMPSMPTTTTSPVISYADRDGVVGLHTAKTLTVKLPALQRDGYEWRLGEIPDPTVLKLVSSEYTPGESPAKAGEQTLVFEAVGPGDVDVKMWYGTLWASRSESTRTFDFIASVTPEPEKVAKKSRKAKATKKSQAPARSKLVPSQPIKASA